MEVFWHNWERFFSDLSAFLRAAERAAELNRDYCEYVLHRLELWIVSLSHLLTHMDNMHLGSGNNVPLVHRDIEELIDALRVILYKWNMYLENSVTVNRSSRYLCPIERTSVGRPRYSITKEQLQYLRSMSFTWVQISQLLGVSYMTVYRRRLEYDLVGSRGQDITDSAVERIVNYIRHEQPAVGQTMVWAHIRSLGYYVTRDRVRRAIHRTDPISSAFRWKDMTPRRPYSVPGPNSLWHLGGQHKLVRWRMVVHAAIDGYSRTVVFIKCSDNNRASTVYHLFLEAVGHYGLPSRIRVDQGGKNIRVAEYMIRHRGVDRRSVLVGSSVHNQRIERLWRDSHRCATAFYYRLFYFLEENDMLNPLDEEDLFALHYVYLPRVNRSLQVFQSSWNDHGLRTEHGQTPKQLFTAGILTLRRSGSVATDVFSMVPEDYGTEEDGGGLEETSGVPVPRISITPTDQQMSELQSNVNPLSDSVDYGVSLYCSALEIVRSWSRTV